ncbi:transposase [Patescibacteria group bacterium]|nr:transposase [Patescibacteria group bacterium]
MARRHLLCQSCNNVLIEWGITQSGKKRYRCIFCNITRTYHTKQNNEEKIYILFKQYILWGNTYEMLSSLSGYSVRYLEKKFHAYFLENPPELPHIDQSSITETFLLIDGLWFGRWFVLMVYRQSGNLVILHIAIAGREVTSKISRDLKIVREMGYRFTGIVSDGGTGIIGAVNKVYPHIPHQICLAHLHRGIIAAIGRYPRDERVKKLKLLADHVWLIESKEALRWWEKQIEIWIKNYHTFLKERRYDIDYNWWYVHKGVRHAVATLKELPQTSFKFLDHPLMPKTTNEIEAQFGHLGKRWLAHRGMKRERWKDFLKWFVYFYNQEKLSQKKTKED